MNAFEKLGGNVKGQNLRIRVRKCLKCDIIKFCRLFLEVSLNASGDHESFSMVIFLFIKALLA